jgi:signal transduction histidine kinase
MTELVWYRSLYWRIALGFVALLAVLLLVQGAVFLYLTGRTTEFFPGRSPAEYAQTIAADLSVALAATPTLDLDGYLNGRYTSAYRPFAVATQDNRLIESRPLLPPPSLARLALGRLRGFPDAARRGPRPDGFGRGGPPADGASPEDLQGRDPLPPGTADGFRGRGGRGRGGGRGPGGFGGDLAIEYAPVVIDGATVAMVAVPVEAPPISLALRSLGPTLALVAAGLLVAGTAVAALLIFGPSHRRMRALQRAAQAVGSGRTEARAVASGGDEVALLAQTFNDMAAGLERHTQALVAADETRRRLLADVSHELMTPLAAIRGYAETLAMPGVPLDDQARRRFLRIIGDEAVRLEHIVGDLLDLARVEGGGGTWRFEPVEVRALFNRVQERHERLLRERGITLAQHVQAGADVVHGDAKRLEQVLQNLAANAIRHTPTGGSVSLSAHPVDDGVSLVVEDTGPGIPADHLPRVFDRFHKVDDARAGTEVPSGSGLGLSIAQAIVARHGGRITAANRDGGGARFAVRLTAAPSNPSPASDCS